MWDYSEKVKEYFFHPRNAKLVEDANARGDVGSMTCGDALSLTLKINPETEVIEDAGFQTFGCGSAIASSSALTEMIMGKTITEAMKVTNNDIADYLDGLPPEKMHCSVMGMEALEAAVADFRGETLEGNHEEGELICKCFAIDDVTIRRVVKANHLTTIEDVIHYTKAGGACASCHEKIEYILDACLAEMAADDQAKGLAAGTIIPTVTVDGDDSHHSAADLDKIELIKDVIEELKPAVALDGGDIHYVDYEDGMVFVSLTGACTGCGLAGLTLANVEQKISRALGEDVTVFPVQDAPVSGKKEGTYNV